MNWILNVNAGTWTVGPTETDPEAESSTNTLGGAAVVQTCTACSGSKSVGYIGGPNAGTVSFNGVSSDVATTTTIRIKYSNGDTNPRLATVTVNGKSQVVSFVATGGETHVFSSTLHVSLVAGTGNTVKIEGYNGGWGT